MERKTLPLHTPLLNPNLISLLLRDSICIYGIWWFPLECQVSQLQLELSRLSLHDFVLSRGEYVYDKDDDMYLPLICHALHSNILGVIFEMPVNPALISSSIVSSAPFPKGPSWGLVAQGIGNGITAWLLGGVVNFSLVGATVGTSGVGAVSGRLLFPPSPSLVTLGLTSVGVVGPTAPLVAQGISIGVGLALSSTALYTGVSTGVAVGTDTSIVSVSNSASLAQALYLSLSSVFTSFGGLPSGIGLISLSQGLGIGLAGQCQLATGIGIVTGSPSPTTTTGTSLSTVI